MSIKDLFNIGVPLNINRSSQVTVSSSLSNLDVESPEYITEFVKQERRIDPHVDFSKPENFAKYGSAKEYYDQSIKYIYNEYPYDGSLKEKLKWRNQSTLIDLYVYDNRYPKTTGYAVLASDGWGTNTGSVVIGYGAPATGDYEYINVKGGPNSIYGASLGTSSLADVFDSKSNIFDQTITSSIGPISATRDSNLRTNLNNGVTVEFWLKKGSLGTSLTEKQVVFDMWNGNASSSADYGRLRIEVDGTSTSSPFMVTVLSGAVGLSTSSVEFGSTLNQDSFSDWQHYAFSFANSGTNIETKLYVNGALLETKTTGSNIGEIRDNLQANVGALLTGTFNMQANAGPNLGWGKLSGSIDEFRFWKTRRTEKDIKRYYFTSNLGGGTNTDTANLDLGIYYKFNEGITGDTTVDNSVLDYSGRVSNGSWQGYPSSNARNSGSAIVSASVGEEELDPILYASHPLVSDLSTELESSGSLWDYENNSSIFHTMPAWIIEGDEGNGTTGDLKKLTQIMGSYLDNLDILIGELPKLKFASYPSSSTKNDGTPDKVYHAYPYMQTALRSAGLYAPELFSNSNVLEYYSNRSETEEYAQEVYDIKNLIYNNIYNNLSEIYRSKGTEKSFRNLIRCFGVGDDLIRINAYADNDTYKFETKRRAESKKTKAINFNHADRFNGTVYQYAHPSNPNSVSYISGSSTENKTYEDSFPITVEAEVVFPKKLSEVLENAGTQEYPYLTASLFGLHTPIVSGAMNGTETDLTWASSDVANFQVYALRDKFLSKDVKFMLTASDGGLPFSVSGLTSSYYQNVYDNSKWNFAVRLKPHGYPQSFASGALDAYNDYIVEFYGVNYIADRKVNEFSVSASVSKTAAENFLTSPKRLFAGAHHTNFTGTVLHRTDTKITSVRYWNDYLENSAIQNHALDPGNFGHPRPNRNTYLLETDLENVEVPEIESLALYWDFETVTGSDASGRFNVLDVSSGSIADTARYSWLGTILKYQHTGRGDIFPASSTGSVENQFLYAAKQQLPEIVFGDDNIRVLSQEETEVFTRETRPTKTYYAFEKSMYQVISDEIINYFGSIVDFNNLVGEPKNRYRQEYKDIKYLRQFFFERVTNTPDLDKFVEYYKWIDATLEAMLMQLVPASAQFSDGIDNVVESHVLERNKYQSKFPIITQHESTEGGAVSINKHLYNWKKGHRPIPAQEDDNCLYWKERAERNVSPLSSGDASVDSNRNSILTASLQVLERTWTTPYRYKLEKTPVIHGGINYSENKKLNFYRGINFPHGPVTSIGLPENVIQAHNIDVVQLKDCDDVEVPNEKKKYSFGTRNGRTFNSGTFDGIKGELAMPFNIITASQGLGGYNTKIQEEFHTSSQLVNLHSDGYGDANEIPMQGPFTEKYVGGHQNRHIRLNSYDANRVGGDGNAGPNNLDGQYTRPEAWRILLGGGPKNAGSIGLTGPDYGGPYPDGTRFRAWFFREETAKRPVNIRNILQTTASVDTVLSGTLQFGPIGNYEKTYQVVQTSGRSTNNFWFNDGQTNLLPKRYRSSNPTTTNVHTLVGLRATTGTRARGNTFIPGTDVDGVENVASLRRLSNRYYPLKVAAAQAGRSTVFELPDRSKQNAVIVERFSAPGGPEINSLGFLDIMAAEKSVYNALPFRNLSVRGSGSGEEVTRTQAGQPISVEDHLGLRRGLRTLSTIHAGQFGSDSVFGTIIASTYTTLPSYYKVNRNARSVIKADDDSTFDSQFQYGSASVYDNWFVQHPIPQNDSQYSWINGSFLSGSKPVGHAPKSGQVSGASGFNAAINFLSSSMPDYSASFVKLGIPSTFHDLVPIDFVGINSAIYDPTGSAFNILSASDPGVSAYRNDSLIPSPGIANWGSQTFNALMLHRNGPYGYSSWRQVSNRYHSLVRQMRANNTISIIDPNTLYENQTLKPYRYNWQTSPASLSDIFGQGVNSLRKNTSFQDREVLQYREPALQQKFTPLRFNAMMNSTLVSGESSGRQYPVEIKSTYANEKSHFSNSDLNYKLNINEHKTNATTLVMKSFSDGVLNGELLNVVYSESVYPAAINVYRSYVRERTTYGSTYWKDLRTERTQNFIRNSQGVEILSQSMWPLDGRLAFDGAADGGVVPVKTAGDFAPQAEGELLNSYNTVHSPFVSGSTVCGNTTVSGSTYITGSATYSRRHTMLTGTSYYSWSSKNRLKSPGDNPNDATPFSGDTSWDAGAQSGKNPFYNSYSDYVSQMKNLGKDYSILPEYRMSERMDYYIVEGGDLLQDEDLFVLTGALSNTTSSGQDNFYKIYSNSDFMKYFDVASTELDSLLTATPSDLTVKCKAMLKLLPYDGFYPANRTLQLATLFSKSYGDNVQSIRNVVVTGVDGTNDKGSWRPFLTPIFAPGIVYNTIKSGIAVDYPIITTQITSSKSQRAGFLAASASLATGTPHTTPKIDDYVIGNNFFEKRLPFETIVSPEEYMTNINFRDMEPHPSCSQNATASWNGLGDDRYRLAMHNFLAETPEFFLENGTFTSFFSAPQKDFKTVQANTTYKMRVQIEKSKKDVGVIQLSQRHLLTASIPQHFSGTEDFSLYSRASAFGPPSQGAVIGNPTQAGFGGGSLQGYNAPFTPPYYDGAAWVDLEYTATADGRPTLDQILSQVTASYRRYGVDHPTDNRFNWRLDDTGGAQNGSRINYNAVQISASVNLLGKSGGLSDLYKYTGAGQIDGEEQWVIQTKFETPILNFNAADFVRNSTGTGSMCSGSDLTAPIGIWHQYGEIPEGNAGVKLLIKDVPGENSLADLVGFAKTGEKLGRVANSKTVREAVVAVPFVENSEGERTFFELNISDSISTSVSQMLQAMGRYVFPPSMDFITYPESVDPFAMYIFEFEHKLNKQDLADIWQNLPPRIGRAFDADGEWLHSDEIMQEKEITHSLSCGELLESADAKLQWMVFKVKQKAQTNYYRKTVTNNPSIAESVIEAGLDSSVIPTIEGRNFSVTDIVDGGAGAGGIEKYGEFKRTYNWPYDFFSLVELVKIDQQVAFTPDSEALENIIQSSQRATGDIIIETEGGVEGIPQDTEVVSREVDLLESAGREIDMLGFPDADESGGEPAEFYFGAGSDPGGGSTGAGSAGSGLPSSVSTTTPTTTIGGGSAGSTSGGSAGLPSGVSGLPGGFGGYGGD